MASNHDQSPTKDPNDTSSLTSETDSGHGLSIADFDVSSPEGENQHHVSLHNLRLDEDEPHVAIEEESFLHGNQTLSTILQESQNTRLQEDDIYTEGDGDPTATGNQQQSTTLPLEGATSGNESSIPQGTEAPSVPQVRPLSYSRKQDVPEELLKEVKGRGDGKSDAVKAFWSAVANHLKEFEEVQDCNFLPLQNGVLMPRSEITTGNITRSTVKIEQGSVRDNVLLYAAVSPDNTITISYEKAKTRQKGTFMTLTKIGEGADGTVYVATDGQSDNLFAVKEVPLEKFGEEDASAFLQLNDCLQVCKPFGLVLDEKEGCVYFLMERLTGRTLKDILKDRNKQDRNKQDPNEQDPNEQDLNEQDPNEQDPNEQEERIPIDIPLAVIITIDLLKGVQYIHSKRLWHSDVAARNVIVFLEDNWIGPRAVLIDTTGARQPTRNIDHAWDNAKIFRLLNDMLNNVFYCKEPWKASAEDKGRYNERSLGRLEKLIKVQSDGSSPEAFTVEKVLQWLQEISEVLEVKDPGLLKPADNPDELDRVDSSEIYFHPSFSTEAKIEDLKKEIKARDRELGETQQKLKDKEMQNAELQKEDKELRDIMARVNKERLQLKSKVKQLQDEILKRQDREKELVTELENLKVELIKKEMGERAENEETQLREDMVLMEVLKDKQCPSEQEDAIKGEDSEEIVLPNPDELSRNI